MNQEPKKSIVPYEDPALIEASVGDDPLLDRLVGRFLAEQMLRRNPGDETAELVLRTMKAEVQLRREVLGLPPEEPDGTTE